ncbi:enoyl-CoA hydratase [uncultured Sphingomonas sp.]|uniref:enoyl-CoA hydratase n=1 Tax=uncultured Sphingomonas sp. TaxID=158754 RepID=UPI0035C97F1F
MSLLRVRHEGAVAVLTLDDPKRRNILSPELCRELSAAVAAANADDAVKAIVITGAAPAFCAGADLDDLQAAANGATDALHAVYQSFMDVADSGLPTIAAVNGAAIGAGLNLALACDMRIAGADALFDTRFLKIGLHPGGGHGWMLLRAVGWAEAARLLLLACPVRAEEAREIGLVQRVVPADGLIEAAVALAGRSEALPRDLLIRTKASLRLAARADHRTAFDHEAGEQLRSLHEPPFIELVQRLQATIAAR